MMDVTTEEQRQAAWDKWGNDVNDELRRIDTWFAAYGYTIPERLGADLQNMLVDLSIRISACPGRPRDRPTKDQIPSYITAEPSLVVPRARFTDEELRAIAATPEDHVCPVSTIDDLHGVQRDMENDKAAAMRRFDAALAERARMRRRGASNDLWLALTAGAACGLLLWWLINYVMGP